MTILYSRYIIPVREMSMFFVLASCVFCIFALLDLTTDIDLFEEDFWPQHFTAHHMTRNFTLRELIDSTNPRSRLHDIFVTRRNDTIQLSWGTPNTTYCEYVRPPLHGLPSLFRYLEFYAGSQVALRITYLLCVCVKPLLSWCHAYFARSRVSSQVLRVILSSTPVLHVIHLYFGYLFLMFHQDHDESIKFLMYFVPCLFAISFLLHSLMLTLLGILNETYKVTSMEFAWRILLISAFAFATPPVLQSHRDFLDFKTCHPYGERVAVLCEYVCIACLALFSVSEWLDFSRYQFVITGHLDTDLLISGITVSANS